MLPPPSLYFTMEKRFLSVRASLSYIHKHTSSNSGKVYTKVSACYLYVETKISVDFHVHSSLPLKVTETNCLKKKWCYYHVTFHK